MNTNDFETKHTHLARLKEFIKSKAKQFKLTTQLQTYPVAPELGSAVLNKVTDRFVKMTTEELKALAQEQGVHVVRYDPARGDVDTSINEFYVYEGEVRKKLTDSLMVFYLENEGGGVIFTFMSGMTPSNYFISAPSEAVAQDFLQSYL